MKNVVNFLKLIVLLCCLFSFNSKRNRKEKKMINENENDRNKVNLGGFGSTLPADNKSRELLERLKCQITTSLNLKNNNQQLVVKNYQRKIVAGTLYKIEFSLGKLDLEAEVFEPLPYTKLSPELLKLDILV